MARREPINPFYVVLLVVGVLFFVTAAAYSVMTLRSDRLGRDAQTVAVSSGLMQFLDKHGGTLLGAELLLLGICTAAAMASDDYWTRRHAPRSEANKVDVR